jgi:signal transduction histidine kinase
MRTGRVAAVVLAALCWAAVAVGLALLAPDGYDNSPYLLVDVVQAILYCLVGAVVARARPGNSVGWLILLVGAGHAAAVLAGGWAAAADRGALGGGDAALWLESWVWFLGLGPLAAVLPLLLPDGRLPSPRWRPVLLANVATVAATAVAIALIEELEVRPGVMRPNPIGVPGAYTAATGLLALSVLGSIVAVASLLVRWRRAGTDLRRQLLPPTAALAVIVIALAIGELAPALKVIIQTLTLPLLPLTCAVSVLRYRLFDVELLIRRSLVYSAISTILLGAYAGTVATVGALLGHRAHLIAPALATGLVAVGFSPVRHLVQRAVARWLFGDRDDPYAAMGSLTRQLQEAAPADQGLNAIAASVAGALRLRFAAVRDRDGADLGVAGTPAPVRARFALVADGEPQGELVVADRGDGEPLSAGDRALLRDLARPIAVQVRAARLAMVVQQAREQLVRAREEERRRLRRDLHDGVGTTMAALTVQVDVVDELWERDPQAARALLRDVRSTAGRAVSEVRQIVHELRPAALDELGLAGALAELASEGSARTVVQVDVPPLPPLPAAVEVAAYRIAQEALGNALRHADARTVQLHVAPGAATLVVTVSDDGRGLPAGVADGNGSTSMRERAAELGGTYLRDSPSGCGTRVRAELPLEVR